MSKAKTWNVPNQLTLLRVLLIPVFVGALVWGFEGSRLWALGVFALASLTDMLDGMIARRYNLITNLGKFMDPLADKLLTMAAFVMFVAMGIMPAWAVILILSRELAVTGFRAVAADKGVVIAAGALGKVKTVSQMLYIIVALPGLTFAAAAFAEAALFWVAVGMTVVSGVEYIARNVKVLEG